MVYELRIYTPVPGRMPDLLRRFQQHTLGIWARLGICHAGFWRTHPKVDGDQLVYMLVWNTLEEREALWAAFVSDSEWIAAKQESEIPGPLVVNITSSLLASHLFSAVT
ncbi:NIPSNAP family protein [Paraburkholderia panacisoli]|uniref:NIPSNAP family protein n=1 Tax=Paraburkholderia panacisoli TaxID=2603818 RepID=A0A5B0GKS8_9BURK|nr:NIPSNAP family protein [Paraburkholderia panacisoli]KAA1004047.1 NIPSNAP family protein [Paraburkholderia panacisoli]